MATIKLHYKKGKNNALILLYGHNGYRQFIASFNQILLQTAQIFKLKLTKCKKTGMLWQQLK